MINGDHKQKRSSLYEGLERFFVTSESITLASLLFDVKQQSENPRKQPRTSHNHNLHKRIPPVLDTTVYAPRPIV